MFGKLELIVIAVCLAVAGVVTMLGRDSSDAFYFHAANFTFVAGVLHIVVASHFALRNGALRLRTRYRSYRRYFVPGTDGRTEPMSLEEFVKKESLIKPRFGAYLIVGFPLIGLAMLFSHLHNIS